MAQSTIDQQDGGSGSPEPTSSAIWTPSVVSSATTALSALPPAISRVQELDAPAANSPALIWWPPPLQVRLSLQPPSLGAPSSLLAHHPLLNPYASWKSLEGEAVECLK